MRQDASPRGLPCGPPHRPAGRVRPPAPRFRAPADLGQRLRPRRRHRVRPRRPPGGGRRLRRAVGGL